MCLNAATALAANAKAAHAAQLDNQPLVDFLFGGDAVFTLFNAATGTRYTYHFEKRSFVPKGQEKALTCYWVKLLTGPHNTRDFTYLGSLRDEQARAFALSPKARVGNADLPSVQAIGWLLNRIAAWEAGQVGNVMYRLEFWHAGRCCRCGRALTVPSSIENGIGPECGQLVTRGVERNRKVHQLK